jgi:hypothetical protein
MLLNFRWRLTRRTGEGGIRTLGQNKAAFRCRLTYEIVIIGY